MRFFLLISLIIGACQPATVDVSQSVSSSTITSPAPTTTITAPNPTTTTTTPLDELHRSLYPYQSEASVAQALQSKDGRPADFDWGIDYVKWIIGWDQAVAFDGTDGPDRWGTFYRSSQDDTIYISMGILGYNQGLDPVVGIFQATTFFDATGYDLTVELTESTDGWLLDLTPPIMEELDLPVGTLAEVLVQFESASFEAPLSEGTTTIRLRDKPHTWGTVQISYRDPQGHAVGWHATVIDPSG
jgi:hypothetical protein